MFRRREYANGQNHSLMARSGKNSGRTRITARKVEWSAVIASSRARTAIDTRHVAGQADDCGTQVRVPRSRRLLSVRG